MSTTSSRTRLSSEGSSSHETLSILCGETTAALHTARFGPGGRSVCVLYESRWMSLAQFETVAGRKSSQNWKRSIRHQGRSLHHWITVGKLRPCDKYCQCHLCRVPVTRQSINMESSTTTKGGPDPPSSNLIKAASVSPIVNLNLMKVQQLEEDSDSGISVDSFSKALKVDISSPAASETSGTSSLQSSHLPDYTTLVQEALLSLTGDVSQINILLYVLHRYDPKEEVTVVNAKVRSALHFLTRMDLVEKSNVDGNPAEDSEDEQVKELAEEEEVIVKVEEATEATEVKPAKKRKLLDQQPNTDEKKKKLVKKQAKDKKINLKHPNAARGVVVMSAPKRLSQELAAICGAKKLCRQAVIKAVWAYIKQKDLQDPKQRTTIICDDKLKAVTKKKRILQTDMLRTLTGHMTELKKNIKIKKEGNKSGLKVKIVKKCDTVKNKV